MRRTLYPALPLALLACGSLLTIEIEESARTTVEAGTLLEELIGDLGFEELVSMDLTQAEELQNQGVAPGDIREVYLRSFTLTALSPEGADLSFLDDMTLTVEAPDLPPLLIAWQDSFPEGVPSVSFELEDVDLSAYVVSESMTILTDVSAHRPEEDTEIRADFALEVVATGQGACNAAKRD